ncbi:MAG: hypothetical protein HC831_13450 [Chloroflexia bacterium]|nr:hypothetical protein [Chloroflexia bacterium]
MEGNRGYKKYNILYLTIHKITGKKYIGSHETDNPNDGYLGSGQYIKNSISNYGKKISSGKY